jgi:hypothetical protein
VAGIVSDAQELLKQEVELFKSEVREDVRKTRDAAIRLGAGAGVTAVGALFVCVMLVLLLHWTVPAIYLWAWFGIVGFGLVACGAALLYLGRSKLTSFNPLPEQSVEALRENVRCITNPK